MDVILNEKSDGFDIAQKIRSKYPTPIIFTTSSDGNTDFNKGFSISNTDYVRKPYKIIEVMKRMERLFENTQSIFTFKLNKYTFIPAERALKFAYGNICLNHLESCNKPAISEAIALPLRLIRPVLRATDTARK